MRKHKLLAGNHAELSDTAVQNTYWYFQEGFGLNNLDVVHFKDPCSLTVRQTRGVRAGAAQPVSLQSFHRAKTKRCILQHSWQSFHFPAAEVRFTRFSIGCMKPATWAATPYCCSILRKRPNSCFETACGAAPSEPLQLGCVLGCHVQVKNTCRCRGMAETGGWGRFTGK